jgi:sulfur relay (sulfurtransferase) complex TusBCD TusD component (DsrE family)
MNNFVELLPPPIMVEKKLGILLFNGPDSQDVHTAIGLADSALNRGIAVEFFMMHQAVLNSGVAALEKLADRGAKITVCAHNADELKAARSEKFHYGGQYDNSNIINDTDRYLAFL